MNEDFVKSELLQQNQIVLPAFQDGNLHYKQRTGAGGSRLGSRKSERSR